MATKQQFVWKVQSYFNVTGRERIKCQVWRKSKISRHFIFGQFMTKCIIEGTIPWAEWNKSSGNRPEIQLCSGLASPGSYGYGYKNNNPTSLHSKFDTEIVFEVM